MNISDETAVRAHKYTPHLSFPLIRCRRDGDKTAILRLLSPQPDQNENMEALQRVGEDDDGMSVGSFSSNASHDEEGSKLSNTVSDGTGRTSRDADAWEARRMLRKDSWVQSLRLLSLCVLLVVGYVVATTVYASLRESEQRAFESKFYDQSFQIGHSFQSELDVKLQALDTLAVAITSYAGTSASGGWPNISIPEFTYRSASTLKIGTGISVGLQPLVRKDNQREWEAYSVANQGWRREGFAFQALFPDALQANSVSEHSHHDHSRMIAENLNASSVDIESLQNTSEHIFRVVDGVPTRVEDNLMMPVWQYSPIDTGLPYVNYDQYGKARNKGALDEVIEKEVAVLGPFFELSESFHG